MDSGTVIETPRRHRYRITLFAKCGIDVVFPGHEHFYERVKPRKGIHYFTIDFLMPGRVRRLASGWPQGPRERPDREDLHERAAVEAQRQAQDSAGPSLATSASIGSKVGVP